MRGRILFGCFGSGGPGDGGGGKGFGGRGSVGLDTGWENGFVSMTLTIGPWRKSADNTINSIIPRFMIAPHPACMLPMPAPAISFNFTRSVVVVAATLITFPSL